MAGVNKVILLGNLGDDPESRSLSNGGEVVNLRIATSESWKDRDGKAHESTDVKQGRTERGNTKWFYRCSDCGTASMRTPCFGCGTKLHKNGLQMTYHLTIADHVANVVCPDCGANF